MEVVISSGWNFASGLNFSEDETIELQNTDTGDSYRWSEDGTEVPSATNRLVIWFNNTGVEETDYESEYAFIHAYHPTNTYTDAVIFTLPQRYNNDHYTFKDVFAANPIADGGVGGQRYSPFFTGNVRFQSDVFKSMTYKDNS